MDLMHCHDMVESDYAQRNFPDLENGGVREFADLMYVTIWWSLVIHSEISPKKFYGRVQLFADLMHVMIQWSPGIQ